MCRYCLLINFFFFFIAVLSRGSFRNHRSKVHKRHIPEIESKHGGIIDSCLGALLSLTVDIVDSHSITEVEAQ